MRMGPNVLLVVFDTARADSLEPYGAPVGSSPAVRQLADRGAVASSAFATSCWTVPSHASMFTGLLPRTIGLGRSAADTPAGFKATMQGQHDRLLPTVLGQHGYATAGVSANLWVSPDSGFDTGFETFRYVRSTREHVQTDTSLGGRLRWTMEAVKARCDDGAAEVEQVLASWLAERSSSGGDRPFFWFVNLVECHSPYLPPKPYNDLGLVGRIRAAADAQKHQTFAALSTACLGGFDVSDGSLERMHHLYDQSVRLMDDWLARLLQGLDTAGVLDETLVLLTSDHGENFGENRLMGHAFSLDDRLIRIPVVTAGPGADQVASSVGSLADIPLAVAEVVGLSSDQHPWAPLGYDGIAVAQLDAPCEPDDPVGLAAIEAVGLGEEAHHKLVTPLACATDGRHKLLRLGATDELLFDLAADPLELAGRTPVYADSDVVRPLRAALDDAVAREVEPVRSDHLASSGDDAQDVDDLKARMELLGYL
jgi:arylsulfatase A-like enzyme